MIPHSHPETVLEERDFTHALAIANVVYQGTTSVVPNSVLFFLKRHGLRRAASKPLISSFPAGFSPRRRSGRCA
jgi:hypothetical protein